MLAATSTKKKAPGDWKATGRGPVVTFWPWSPGLGCVAYRDEKGSDFIQMLVEVLRADPKADLLEQMTEVSWGGRGSGLGRGAGFSLLLSSHVLLTS